jgi:hypothetical protein
MSLLAYLCTPGVDSNIGSITSMVIGTYYKALRETYDSKLGRFVWYCCLAGSMEWENEICEACTVRGLNSINK